MLLRSATLDGIAAGRIDRAFRRWLRPTVKAGGTLRTAIGVLAIDEVTPIAPEDVTDAEAVRAGFADRGALLRDLPADRASQQLYRIAFHLAGRDPRETLREDADLSAAGIETLRTALARLDALAGAPGWSQAMLARIGGAPGERAADIAASIGMEKLLMKTRIRRLKELGLTESLPVGYRLSPRGRALLDAIGSAE